MKDSDTELSSTSATARPAIRRVCSAPTPIRRSCRAATTAATAAASTVSTFGNRDLTWEKADQFDAGFDITLFKGRVNIMADAYYKKTKDLLYSTPIHSTTGVTSIISNIGSMRNIGAELTIATHFNFGPLAVAVQRHQPQQAHRTAGRRQADLDQRQPSAGRQGLAFYLFIMDGILLATASARRAVCAGIRAGDVKWRDVDDNNLINDSDRQVIDSSNPYFSGGWNNTFRYKGVHRRLLYLHVQQRLCGVEDQHLQTGTQERRAGRGPQPLDGTRFDRSPSALGERRHEQHPQLRPLAQTVRSCGCVR